MTDNMDTTEENTINKRVRCDYDLTNQSQLPKTSTTKALQDHLALAFVSLQHPATKKFATQKSALSSQD